MNVKKCLCFTVITGALVIGAVTLQAVNNKGLKVSTVHSTGSYALTLNEENYPDGENGIGLSFKNEAYGNVKTTLGHDVNLTFNNAKANVDALYLFEDLEIAPHGMIHNLRSGNTKLTGVNGVKFSGSGSFLFKPAIEGGILPEIQPIEVAAGTGDYVAVPTCDYFELEAKDGGVHLTELNFSYSCDANAYDVKMLNGTYTGIGSDSSTYKMTITDGAGSIESLDKLSNIQLSGTAAMTSKTSVRFTFMYGDYKIYYDMSYDGHTLAFVAKSDEVGGAAANQVAQVSLNRVYNVEDFESYSATGQGYTNSDTKYQTSGLRAKIYADYYTGSDTGEIGGSGWPIMTSTDNTTLLNTKGHGSKGGAFKFSNGTSMRYIAMNELYGVKQSIGKGNVLSFWARGAYTNTNFNTNHSSNTPMKFYAYYATPLTPSNQTTVRETFDFTVQAGATWQHFEMPLTEGRTYYGFGFYAQQSSGSTQYVPIDDIQIYTASPYAEYIAPVAVTGVTVSPSALELTRGNSNKLTATVAPNDATNKTVSWSSSNEAIATVDSDGTVHAVSAGNATITATTEDGGFTSSCSLTVNNPASIYPEGTFMATVSGYKLTIAIGNETNGLVAVKVSSQEASATGISYNSSTRAFTITTTGSVGGYTVGNITGTYDFDNDQLINVNCSGQLSAAVSNATLTRPENLYKCEGTTSELQNEFGRRYRSKGASSWSVDNSNSDRITSDTTNVVSGESGMSVRPCGNSYDAYGFVMKTDFNPGKTVGTLQFWVYNPCDYDIVFRGYYYKGTGFGSNGQIGFASTDKAKAHSWTYISRGFTNSTIYNFTITVWTADQTQAATSMSARLVFDDILLF